MPWVAGLSLLRGIRQGPSENPARARNAETSTTAASHQVQAQVQVSAQAAVETLHHTSFEHGPTAGILFEDYNVPTSNYSLDNFRPPPPRPALRIPRLKEYSEADIEQRKQWEAEYHERYTPPQRLAPDSDRMCQTVMTEVLRTPWTPIPPNLNTHFLHAMEAYKNHRNHNDELRYVLVVHAGELRALERSNEQLEKENLRLNKYIAELEIELEHAYEVSTVGDRTGRSDSNVTRPIEHDENNTETDDEGDSSSEAESSMGSSIMSRNGRNVPGHRPSTAGSSVLAQSVIPSLRIPAEGLYCDPFTLRSPPPSTGNTPAQFPSPAFEVHFSHPHRERLSISTFDSVSIVDPPNSSNVSPTELPPSIRNPTVTWNV